MCTIKILTADQTNGESQTTNKQYNRQHYMKAFFGETFLRSDYFQT